MNSKREEAERIVGGKIESLPEQPLPGLTPSPGSEVVYFQDDGTLALYEQFDRLTKHVSPPLPNDGGASTTRHTLTLPDGRVFHAIKYRGDVEGWRRQIAVCAEALGIVLGNVQDATTFVTTDGKMVALSECVHRTV